MAIPVLYWMLECTACGTRFVVHDSYRKFVGYSTPDPQPGDGYGGPPLPERYTCAKGCSRPLRPIGAIRGTDDEEMWLHDPHVPVKMTRARTKEWQQLIQAAGLAEAGPALETRRERGGESGRPLPNSSSADGVGSSVSSTR